jgi:hypothetical protein
LCLCTTAVFGQTLMAPGSTTVLPGKTWDAAVDTSGETLYDAQYWDLTAGDITISYSVDLTDAELTTQWGGAPTYAPVRFGPRDDTEDEIDQAYAGWAQTALGWTDDTVNQTTLVNGYTSGGQEDEYSFQGPFPGIYDGTDPYASGAGNYTLDATIGNGFKYNHSGDDLTHDIVIQLRANVADYSGTPVHSAYLSVDGVWQNDGNGNLLGFDFTGDMTEMYLGLGWNDWDWNTGTGGGTTVISDITVTQVPEPTSLVLLALGGLAVLGWRRRR